MAMPNDWPTDIIRELNSMGYVPGYRPHPSRKRMPKDGDYVLEDGPSLDIAIDRSRAVVVWTSSVAITAIIRGKPVFYCGPRCAAGMCANVGISNIDRPPTVSYEARQAMIRKLAALQASMREIVSGEAWERATR